MAKHSKLRRGSGKRIRTRRRARVAVLDRRAFSRFVVVLLVVAAILVAVPEARRSVAATGDMIVAASIMAREADTRRARIAKTALRHRISVEMASAIQEAAIAEGIDPELGFRLVRVESGFREQAVSPVGALGLAQLMPATAEELQPGITREELLQREVNLRLGFRYLHWLLELYDGRVDEALHAYNRGPGTVARVRARGEDPANGYADRVLGTGRSDVYTGSGFYTLPAPHPTAR